MPCVTAPAFEISTERLLLRPWRTEDAKRVRESLDRSASILRPWVPFMRYEPRSLEQTREWLDRRREWFIEGINLCYAMFAIENGELVGEMTLMKSAFDGEFEFGYWVDSDYLRQGLATEGSAALVRLVFELHQAQLIEAKVARPNVASLAVPRKLGFTHEGTRARRYVDCEGKRHDMETFVLFAEEYPDSPSSKYPVQVRDETGAVLLDQM